MTKTRTRICIYGNIIHTHAVIIHLHKEIIQYYEKREKCYSEKIIYCIHTTKYLYLFMWEFVKNF